MNGWITVEFFIKKLICAKDHASYQTGRDVERLISKVPLKKVNPREVLQIARGLLAKPMLSKTDMYGASNDIYKDG